MSGPTRFATVLKECRKQVLESTNPKIYHIILIITDGEIHDLKETIEVIADMAHSNLPVSIIIVGVGNEDFSNMARLDGDELAI